MLLALCLLVSLGITAYAASYSGNAVFPGLSGILPEDSLTLPNNTIWANLTARWGVRVSFVDWDETLLKTELVPVTDTEPGSSSAPEDSARTGYIFTGWERYDTNNGPATLNDDGTVTGVNGPGPIVFIATYMKKPVGSLTVSKTIAGNAADSTQAFDFTVTLNDTSVSGTYGDMTFTDGIAAFSLKGGESRTAADLPAGIGYTVTEADYSADGYETAKSGDAGTIVNDRTATAAFTNTKNTTEPPTPTPPEPTPPEPTPPEPPADPEVGNLTVSETIAGSAADSTKAFDFTVTLDDTSVNGTYGDMTFTDGVAVFSLKGGESRTAVGLPAGTGYTVTQTDYSADGYESTWGGDTGIIADAVTSTAKFISSRSDVPDTGDDSNMLLWFSLIGISALGMTGILFRDSKQKTQKAQLLEKQVKTFEPNQLRLTGDSALSICSCENARLLTIVPVMKKGC